MRVLCVAETPTQAQAVLLGDQFSPGRTEYAVEAGREYTVLGIGFWSGLVWYEIAVSMRTLISIPAFLFRIVDGRGSRHWTARNDDDNTFTCWPLSFYHPHYHYHLSEGVPEAMEDFQSLYSLLHQEAMAPS